MFAASRSYLGNRQSGLGHEAEHRERGRNSEVVCPLSLKRRLTLDAVARVTRMGRAEPRARRVESCKNPPLRADPP